MNTITPQLIERLKNCEPETFKKIEVMSYHSGLKTIEMEDSGSWITCNPAWDWWDDNYRPAQCKPPPIRYRPWEGPHEVRVGILIRSKHEPWPEMSPSERHGDGLVLSNNGCRVLWLALFNDYQCSYDGQNWTACGVECK